MFSTSFKYKERNMLTGNSLGVAFTSTPIALLLNNLKAPYNISSPTSQLAQNALSKSGLAVMHTNVSKLLEQRSRLIQALTKIPGIGRFRGGFDANFILVEMLDSPGGKPDNTVAQKIYEKLAERKGVVVRFRGKEIGCEGCLRMTVGTEDENTQLLRQLEGVLQDVVLSSKK